MTLWLDPVTDDRAVPLEKQPAALGEYLDAVADDAWQSNPVPSLYRWQQRMAADYGPLGGLLRSSYLAPLAGLAEQGLREAGVGAEHFKARGKWLTKEEAAYRGKELGLKIDRAMSEEGFESLATERRRRLANEAVFDRARVGEAYGPGRAALSTLLEFATTAVDPLNLASAFLPVSRIPWVAGQLERIGHVGARRLTAGALEGAVGAAVVEPAVAAAAVDENPDYGFSHALLNIAFGASLGAGLHWLGGKIVDYRARPADTRAAAPSARDVLERAGEAQDAPAPARATDHPATAPELAQATPETPQRTAVAIEQLHPETRAAIYDTALRQAANDLSTDVHVLAGADRNWVPIRAAGQGPAYRLAGWDPASLRRELAEMRTRLADLEVQRAADPGRKFAAPAGWTPTPALLQQAKDHVKPPKGRAEPESLATFVRRRGGIDIAGDGTGELRASDLKGSGLMRNKRTQGVSTLRTAGHSADDMAEAAWEAGYFPERPDLDTFIQALIADAGGSKRFAAGDMTQAAEAKQAAQSRGEFEDWMAAHPLGDPRDMSPNDLAYWLSLDPVERRLAELDDLQSRGVISREEATERASLLDRALAADEEAAARELLDATRDRAEGFEKDLEGARTPADDDAGQGQLTREEFDALAERSGLPEEAGGPVSDGAGRSAPAGVGEERGAPGARGEPAPAAAAGAVSRAGPEAFQAEGSLTDTFNPAEFESWIKRQGDWRADAHADPAASAKAEAVIADRSKITPEQDLAELEAAAKPLLTEEDRVELKDAAAPYVEARTMVDAYAACRAGGAS